MEDTLKKKLVLIFKKKKDKKSISTDWNPKRII